ncbi:MutS-related protein [Pedobacter aquatilis]|uniref:MutS-related protein n=1 Tax=Pedobacter aquatilis TaxID=351343 RepID=UPI002931D2B7|nr:DNA mismatch repair protein MutS [Pedobacter aquatilis]
MIDKRKNIPAEYSEWVNNAELNVAGTRKLIDQLSLVRIGLFLAEVLCFVLLLNSADNGWRVFIAFLMALPVFCFVLIVRKQSMLDKKLSFENKLLWVYQNESNILNGMDNGYDDGEKYVSEAHPYTSDLDIFGKSSLFSLLNRCSTANGNDLLAARFMAANTVDEIILRQEAIAEMAGITEKTFAFRANLLESDPAKITLIKEQLQAKLAEKLSFVQNRFLKFYVKLVPFITVLLLLGGVLAGGIFWNLLAFFFFAHIFLNAAFSSKTDLVFYSFSGGSDLLNNYSAAIQWTETQQWKSNYLRSLFIADSVASKEIKALAKIIQQFDSRLNLMIGSILNGLLLWDFRCCVSLDKWLKSSSKNVISALDNLGNFEEIVSLGTLRYNQPEWVFPTVKKSFSLSAHSLGHPLIKEKLRVVNDFNLKDVPTVDVITGSNMAGKSTFLRTVGINMVLAYAGAPVCAKEMELSVFAINTYMRIKDSLNESTSTFKAELNRLKMILNNVAHTENTFVFIDEMLRGTNSRDKYLGSKVFIEKLLELKRSALFATHDLQLADMQQEHPQSLRNYHFDISIKDGEMMFDYKLKQGPCATFNAAILLKEIGLAL